MSGDTYYSININMGRALLRLLYTVIFVNISAVGFIVFYPASSSKGAELDIAVLFALFWIVLTIAVVFSGSLVYRDCEFSIRAKRISLLADISFLVCLAGVFFVLLDKVYIRGIDYTEGLRMGRYIQYETASGFFGKLGNSLLSIWVPSIIVSSFFADKLKLTNRIKFYFSSLLPPLIVCALSGGRSLILVLLCVLWLSFLLRTSSSIKILNFKIIFLAALFSVIGMSYSGYIFNNSSTMSNATMPILEYKTVYALGGVLDEGYKSCKGVLECSSSLIVVYLFHGLWTTQQAMLTPNVEGGYLFALVDDFKNKLWGASSHDERLFADSGAFVSMPGAAFMEGGWFGVVIFSLCYGIIFSIVSKKLLKQGVFPLLTIGTWIFLAITIVLAPVTTAFNFPFAFIHFLFIVFWSILFRIRIKL
jgi:hypothetical protein